MWVRLLCDAWSTAWSECCLLWSRYKSTRTATLSERKHRRQHKCRVAQPFARWFGEEDSHFHRHGSDYKKDSAPDFGAEHQRLQTAAWCSSNTARKNRIRERRGPDAAGRSSPGHPRLLHEQLRRD